MSVKRVPGSYPGATLDDVFTAVMTHNTDLGKSRRVHGRDSNPLYIVCSSGKENCTFRAHASAEETLLRAVAEQLS